MTKTCILCASEFKATRSDAQYCSERCRAKANYRIRKKKNNLTVSPDIYEDNSPINLTSKKVENAQICIKGVLSIEEITQMISKFEHEIAQVLESKNTTNAQNEQLYAQISGFQNQIMEIEEHKIKKLSLVLDQTDVDIYNRFLNGEYINAIKKGDSFAKSKLKTESDLGFNSAISMRKSISDYRLKIQKQIISLQANAQSLKAQLKSAQSIILKNEETIKEYYLQVRFYQNRIIRFEHILSG